jgi:hypothetical protein
MPAVDDDRYISLREATHYFNPSRPPHLATLWRWAMRGVRGTRLHTFMCGGRRYTSTVYCREFLEHLNAPQTTPTMEAAPIVTPAGQRACERLENLGA